MCQLFTSKDFETSLLTLLGVSLVLWRRKADNEHSNPLFYCPSPLNSQHLHFQFKVASLLKIFVRSRCDWEKKCREESRHFESKMRQSSCTAQALKIWITQLNPATRIVRLSPEWMGPLGKSPASSALLPLKGSLTRDFRAQVFFMSQCPPGP